MHRPSTGLVALSGFFVLGAIIAGATCVALLLPGGPLEPMWRLNPPAYVALQGMGAWAIVLMVAVAAGCAGSAWGLWIRARWGHRLAVALLVVNVVGDAMNALMRGDRRTLIGLPIGIALVAYLLSAGVRGQFTAAKAAV